MYLAANLCAPDGRIPGVMPEVDAEVKAPSPSIRLNPSRQAFSA